MKTQKIVPIGIIHVPGLKSYYLINPNPLQPDWENGEWVYRFLVVPFVIDQDRKSVHKCPREIVTDTFLIEYDTTIRAIECELPYDIMDNPN